MKKAMSVFCILGFLTLAVRANNEFKSEVYTCSKTESTLQYDDQTGVLKLEIIRNGVKIREYLLEGVKKKQEDVNHDLIQDDVYYLPNQAGNQSPQKIYVTRTKNNEVKDFWLMYYADNGAWNGLDIFNLR